MWKSVKQDEKTGAAAPSTAGTAPNSVTQPADIKKEFRPMENIKSENFRADVAHIGKSVIIRGELSGSEDLYLDGEVEGSIDLREHNLTIGPHGRVRANVSARDVTVHGKVDGNVNGSERVELKRSAVLVGDISTQRIVIEDGAYFKGAIDIKKEAKSARVENKQEPAKVEAKAAIVSAAGAGLAADTHGGFSPQASLMEPRKF